MAILNLMFGATLFGRFCFSPVCLFCVLLFVDAVVVSPSL